MIFKVVALFICIPIVWANSSLQHLKSYEKLIDDAYYKDAKSVAQLQLKVVRELHGEKDSLTLLWMNNLAEADLILANYKESLRLLEIVNLQAKAQGKITTSVSNQLLRSLVLKANAYQSMGQIESCEKIIKKASNLINNQSIIDSKILAQLHLVKAKLNIDIGKEAQAQKFLSKALKIFDEEGLLLWKARAQQLSGELLLQKGQLIQGRNLIDQSIMLRGELQLKRHPDWADALDGMAALLILSGNLGAPLSLVDKAQNIRLEVFDKKHPEQLKSLKMRAFLMETIGDNRSALKQQKSLYAKTLQMFADDHPDLFTINLALSRLHIKTNDLSTAKANLIRARSIYEIHFKHSKVKKIRVDLIQALLYASSAKYFKANSIYQSILKSKDFPGRAEVLQRAAEVLLFQGNSEAAELHLSERLNLIISNYGNAHPQVGTAIKKLAALYYEEQQPQVAVKLIKDNLERLISKVGEDHPEVLNRLSELIFYQQIAKQLSAAAESFELALKIQKRNFGHDNSEVLETMTNLAGVYGLLERKKKANNLLREIRLIQAGGNPRDKDILFENSPGSKNQ